ncbi:OB-fold domain-containing protein [Mycobacterium sp. CVI_P3]|uniref:OB-fold domain-containing protein n=1 Tax=Mycobacterium pinniadriaticum TaxID=2994102 RepID=A0ABT3SDU6_9MYCO|nr:OB-fold domain-containing protein [Mycobacterium pinniadriaticum]MCX2930633.1 OB-fold domain-containing protein [Mycobacterium pinniadriaticum]MCX2937057.1 OB-fold domain-containing protein [Mycobacterium pinniadriaticum]
MTVDPGTAVPAAGHRLRPLPTPDEEPFWRAGADGTLLMQRCNTCSRWQHPPNPVCFDCLSRDVTFESVSGTGWVYSFTVNHQPWLPHLEEPFAVIVVELDEQPGLRFVSRIVDTPVDTVAVGMRVRVVFDSVGDGLFVPLFTAETS